MKQPQIKIAPPKSVHIIAWSKPKISYRIQTAKGEPLVSCNQGFERMAGFVKNLQAVASLFPAMGSLLREIPIYWVANRNSKKIISKGRIEV